MKWLIASDIHGSAFYCRMLMEKFKEEKADRLLLLGDLLYHGPRNDLPKEYAPKAVIEMLNSVSDDIICVRGNCEAEVDQMVLNFPVLADYAVICVGDKTIYATHGHHLDNFKNIRKDSILLFGHTHIPENTEKDGILHVNPGSVSIPKQNSPHSYIVMDDSGLEWKDLTDGETYMEHKF